MKVESFDFLKAKVEHIDITETTPTKKQRPKGLSESMEGSESTESPSRSRRKPSTPSSSERKKKKDEPSILLPSPLSSSSSTIAPLITTRTPNPSKTQRKHINTDAEDYDDEEDEDEDYDEEDDENEEEDGDDERNDVMDRNGKKTSAIGLPLSFVLGANATTAAPVPSFSLDITSMVAKASAQSDTGNGDDDEDYDE